MNILMGGILVFVPNKNNAVLIKNEIDALEGK